MGASEAGRAGRRNAQFDRKNSMKDILNQVVATEKAAQANVIRRREETAATRLLLNTAKLMDQHPTLMRLKELEALKK